MVYNWNVVFEEAGSSGGDSPGAIGSIVQDDGSMPPWFRDARRHIGAGNEFVVDIDPVTFRSIRNSGNRYLIDRQVQRTQTYTGITGTNTQDRAVQESMGAMADRSLERLGTTDRAIIATRRHLLQAVKTVEEGGDPPGIEPSYYRLRAFETVLPKEQHWFPAMKSKLMMLEEPLAAAP
jgi:hypothetical protein